MNGAIRFFLAVLTLAGVPSWATSDSSIKNVGMVLGAAGKDDKSFNASAYAGLTRAKNQYHFNAKVITAPDENASDSILRQFARSKFDLIIAIGFIQADAVKKVAALFPGQKFLLVDGKAELPNVQSAMFNEHEVAFLAGAAAAMKTKTSTVGFIGGMDVPLIRRFQVGYEAGAKYIDPKIKVISNYVGVTVNAFSDPAKARELAVSQFSRKADVVFAAAGSSGLGLFDAAASNQKFAIGVDSNQNGIKPGFVLTSAIKNVDVAVSDACKDVAEGKFQGGIKTFGLSNQGVGLALDENNRTLIDPASQKKLKEIESAIVSGKVKVPDYYLMQRK